MTGHPTTVATGEPTTVDRYGDCTACGEAYLWGSTRTLPANEGCKCCDGCEHPLARPRRFGSVADLNLMNELSLLHRLEKHARSLIEDEHLNVGLNDAWGLIETIEALDKLRIAQAATLSTSSKAVSE